MGTNTKEVTVNGGIGFFGLLFIALLVLKIMGYIEIGWLALFAVLFAPLLIVLAFFGLFFGVALLVALSRK